jgi:dephospho-CoA kinase
VRGGSNGVALTNGSGLDKLLIGLTGPIAAGKSTVASMLVRRGAEVIDADVVYRTLLVPGSDLARSLMDRFGPAIARPDGAIDRAALADIVFANAEALADLDRLTHPAVAQRIRELVSRSTSAVIVIEAVKLIEAGLAADVDAVWHVTADPAVRLRRLVDRSGLSEEAAARRVSAVREPQPSAGTPAYTIDSSEGLANTERQVADAWRLTTAARWPGADRMFAEEKPVSERIEVDVYFDYACPYVHSAASWLAEIGRQLGDAGPTVRWRYFPLEQVNAPADAEVAIWDLPPEKRSRGRDSLHAAAAARRQGEEQFRRFHNALLALKHEEDQDHGRQSVIEAAARQAGIDLARFKTDLDDRGLLAAIRDDYQSARNELGVFGTPTFVFANGQAAYLQVLPPPPPEDAVVLWDEFVRSVRDRPYLREIKRPRRPT